MTTADTEQTPGRTTGRHLVAFALLALALVCERFGYYAMRTPLVMHLIQDVGLDALAARHLIGSFSKFVAIFGVFGALPAIVVPRSILTAVGFFFSAVGTVMLAAPNLSIIYLSMVFIVGGLALSHAALFSFAMESLPGTSALQRMAAVSGLYAIVNISAMASGFSASGVMTAFGIAAVFGIAGGAGLVSAMTATGAAIAAPRAEPAPPMDGFPLLGALAVILLTLPATWLASLVSSAQFTLSMVSLPGRGETMFATLNPTVVILTATIAIGALLLIHRARLRVDPLHIVALGSVAFALVALPFVGASMDAKMSPPLLIGTAIAAAAFEYLLYVPLIAILASAGRPRFGTLALSAHFLSLYFAGMVGDLFPPPGIPMFLPIACVVFGVALFFLARPLRRALFRDPEPVES